MQQSNDQLMQEEQDLTLCKRTECHQHDKRSHCFALNDTNFNGRECPFFKTDAEYLRQETERLMKRGVKTK